MKIYKEKEEVTFIIGSETFTGTILSTHVSIKNGNNHVVFNKLGINYNNRTEFCSKYYGYKAGGHGAWPTCKSGDYEALSRLIHALQELCDKHNGWTLSSQSTQELKVGDWVECISNDYTYAKNYIIGKKYRILQIDANNPVQKYLVEAEHGNDYWQEVPGKCFIPCESIEQVKVGDYVKCISHSDYWSKKFVIGQAYKVRAIIQNSYSVITSDGVAVWVSNQDFILCNDELQDDSEWKVGDKIQYISDEHDFLSFYDGKIGNVYSIYLVDEDGVCKFIDDADNAVSILRNERKLFKKIINNQKQQSYVKDNSNNSFELSSSSPAISARQTARGGIVSSSDLEIWI